jgi:hypothetical protein
MVFIAVLGVGGAFVVFFRGMGSLGMVGIGKDAKEAVQVGLVFAIVIFVVGVVRGVCFGIDTVFVHLADAELCLCLEEGLLGEFLGAGLFCLSFALASAAGALSCVGGGALVDVALDAKSSVSAPPGGIGRDEAIWTNGQLWPATAGTVRGELARRSIDDEAVGVDPVDEAAWMEVAMCGGRKEQEALVSGQEDVEVVVEIVVEAAALAFFAVSEPEIALLKDEVAEQGGSGGKVVGKRVGWRGQDGIELGLVIAVVAIWVVGGLIA